MSHLVVTGWNQTWLSTTAMVPLFEAYLVTLLIVSINHFLFIENH